MGKNDIKNIYGLSNNDELRIEPSTQHYCKTKKDKLTLYTVNTSVNVNRYICVYICSHREQRN